MFFIIESNQEVNLREELEEKEEVNLKEEKEELEEKEEIIKYLYAIFLINPLFLIIIITFIFYHL